MVIPGSVVIGQQRQKSVGDTDGEIQGQLVQFFYDAQGRHRLCGVLGYKVGLGSGGHHCQRILQGGGEADGQNGAQVLGGIPQIRRQQVQIGGAPAADQIDGKTGHRRPVGEGRGHARAHRAQAQELGQDEQRVQQDIQDAAEGDPEGGGSGAALRPDQIRQEGVENGEGAAQYDDPFGVSVGSSIGSLGGAAQVQHGIGQQSEHRGEEQGGQQAAGQRDSGDPPGALLVLTAQGPGDGAGPAHAEEVGNGGQHQKGGIGHRGFMGGVQHPHKVGVRQIVDQRDHLTGHGRDYLQQHGLSDGCLRKDLQILFPVHIHSTCDS